MELIYKFSGIVAMAIAWLFVVSPGIIAGVDGRRQTITYATKQRKFMRIINFGLVVGAIFQAIFILYVANKVSLDVTNPSILLYLSTNAATVLVAIFIEAKHKKLHDFFTQYYFVLSPLSILILGLQIQATYSFLAIVSIIIPIIYLVGEAYLINKYRTANSLMEQFAFILLSIWVLVVTFF